MPKATQTPSWAARRSTSPSPSKAAAKRAWELYRCTKCEGRPLRVMCEHTKIGRLHLENERERVLSMSAGPHTSTQVPPMEPSAANFSLTSLGQLPHIEFQQEPLPPPVPDTNPCSAQNLVDTVLPSQSDPLLTLSPPPLPPIAPASLSASLSSGTAVKPSEKCPRATASNPIFGHVEGVYRGEVLHPVHRGHVLPKRIDDRDKCQKQFLEGANSILVRCEDLAAQTGCWLFIGMQHATARAAPLHYASPRLHLDAPDAISEFARDFCTTMNSLTDARRRDTFEVQQNLLALEVERAGLEQELASLRDKTVGKEALLRLYEEKFGALDL